MHAFVPSIILISDSLLDLYDTPTLFHSKLRELAIAPRATWRTGVYD